MSAGILSPTTTYHKPNHQNIAYQSAISRILTQARFVRHDYMLLSRNNFRIKHLPRQ